MTFRDPPPMRLRDELYLASLPKTDCAACHAVIKRRAARVTIRASWRENYEQLCPRCWHAVIEWAKRFMLAQIELGLSPGEDYPPSAS